MDASEMWTYVRVPRNQILRTAGLGWFPSDHLDEILPDVERLIRSIIHGHTDDTNVNMHHDELDSELRLKLASVLSRRDTFFPSRPEFFGFLKVSLIRHLKSHTQKFVFTYKRTGIKADDPTPVRCPVRMVDENNWTDSATGGNDEGYEHSDLEDELNSFIGKYLTEIEARVIRQEYEPNAAALRLAMAASGDNTRKFRVVDRFKAAGVGLPLHVYKRTLIKIRAKMERYWRS